MRAGGEGFLHTRGAITCLRGITSGSGRVRASGPQLLSWRSQFNPVSVHCTATPIWSRVFRPEPREKRQLAEVQCGESGVTLCVKGHGSSPAGGASNSAWRGLREHDWKEMAIRTGSALSFGQ